MEKALTRRAVVFHSPFRVEVCAEPLAPPKPEEAIVQVDCSAISAGTELLVYRGQIPAEMPLDSVLPALVGEDEYPLRFGYAAVGTVKSLGPEVPIEWLGRRVFCFHPHASHVCMRPEDMIPIPEDVAGRDALFLAQVETAVTLIMDGRPVIGEHAVVFGQGIVGLIATALLSRHPLKSLFAVEPAALRREASLQAGAHAVFDPGEWGALQDRLAADSRGAMADLVFELSGDPQALNSAIAAAGFGARVVIGSWYGTKRADIHLGGRFHRSRIRLLSSQVSTLPAELTARWTRSRRLEVAWEMIRRIQPSRFITHQFAVERAHRAYELLDQRPSEALQVVLTYG